MEKNKVIRRQAGSMSNGYEKIAADFTELFQGFNNVTIESTEGGSGSAQTKIYFDTNNKMYIRIIPDENSVARISLHCGSGTRETN